MIVERDLELEASLTVLLDFATSLGLCVAVVALPYAGDDKAAGHPIYGSNVNRETGMLLLEAVLMAERTGDITEGVTDREKLN